MQLVVASAVVLSAVVLPSLAQGPTFMVNSPSSCSECTGCLLSWSEQNPSLPFLVSILPAGQTAAPPIIPPVTTNSSSITFLAPFAQSFTIQVTDGQGMKQFSSIIPVVPGASTSCQNDPKFNAFPSDPNYTVGNGASTSPSSSGSSSGSSSSSSGSSAAFTTPPTTGSPSSSSGSSSGSSTATTTSPSGSPTHTSSATALTSSFFALFGVLVATLFA